MHRGTCGVLITDYAGILLTIGPKRFGFRKSGMSTWTWLAGGNSGINSGAVSNGQIQLSGGHPDANLSEPRYSFRLAVEEP